VRHVTPPEQPDDSLAGTIIKLRERLGLSQVKFAKLVGTTERTVKRWEGGVVPQKKFRPALIAQGVDTRLFERAAMREQAERRLRFVESEVAKLRQLLT
jgi:transcriptional regulator with XRE-family HTH domain